MLTIFKFSAESDGFPHFQIWFILILTKWHHFNEKTSRKHLRNLNLLSLFRTLNLKFLRSKLLLKSKPKFEATQS